MNNKSWVTAAALAAAFLLSGCSGGAPIEQPGFVASKPLPSSATPTTSTVSESDRCAATVNVIGLGNPGDGGPDAIVSSAYEALKKKLIAVQENDPQGVTSEKVSLTIPTYEGDTQKLRSMIDDMDGSDDYASKISAASNALTDALELSGKKCPGSHVVFIGHGFGAAAIRLAVHLPTPQQNQRISGVWLIADQSRDSTENDIATFNGESDHPTVGDATAGGTLNFYGIRGTSFDFTTDIRSKVLTVCFPDDLECNLDMEFVQHKENFIASHGGSLAALHNLKKQYTDTIVTDESANWISSRVGKDVDAARASKNNGAGQSASASPLQKYLNYVNQDAAGAQVVQDDMDHPDAITSCDADYAVIGLRGSGQNADGTMNDNNGDKLTPAPVNGSTYYGGQPAQGGPVIEGFPEFLASSAWKIKTTLPTDKKIRFIPVEYAAVALEGTLLPNKDNQTNFPRFFESATQGAALLDNKIRELEAKCPNTKMVLMGYSQGAQSVHQTLYGVDEDHAKNIAAVIFVSDPLRRSEESVPFVYDPMQYPNEFAEQGSMLFSTAGSMGVVNSSFPIPETFRGKVVEICDLRDIVCNAVRGASIPPHSEAYRHDDHFVFPATWAAQNLMNNK